LMKISIIRTRNIILTNYYVYSAGYVAREREEEAILYRNQY
jgi:hypothetical protein